jgi:hypothetical protein
MQPTSPRSPRPGASRVSNRERLSQRRRKYALRVGGATLIGLLVCWVLLRPESAATYQRASDWLDGAFGDGSANAVAKSSAEPPSVGARRPQETVTAALRTAPPSSDSSARARADLRGPEAGTEVDGVAETAPVAAPRTARAAATPVASAPVPTSPSAPSERPPVAEAPAEPEAPAAPGTGDVLGDLVPSDFEGSLGASASAIGIAADVATNLDVDLEDGTAQVDAGVRVETPVAAVDVGTQIGVSPGAANVGTELAVGPAVVASNVAVGPGRVTTSVGAVGANVDLGESLAADLDLRETGLPVTANVDASDGLQIDLGTGGLAAPVGGLVDALPLNNLIRLH